MELENRKKISKIRGLIFLAAAISLLLSVYLFFYTGDKQNGLFVGLWAPTILAAGTFLLGVKNNV